MLLFLNIFFAYGRKLGQFDEDCVGYYHKLLASKKFRNKAFKKRYE